MTKIKNLIIAVLFTAPTHWCSSQPTVDWQHSKDNYFSITFENDGFYFQKPSDKYYTNGFRFERIGPQYERKNYLLNKLLLGFKKNDSTAFHYGFFWGQNMYTPVDITVADIQFDDRPYAGWLYAGVKKMSTNLDKNRRLISELYIGIIGPYSFAEETQTFVHKITDSEPPQGWHNQIDSDIGILYTNRYEFQLAAYPRAPKRFYEGRDSIDVRKDFFEAIPFGEAQVGTIYNNIGAGFTFRLGFMTPYFQSYNPGSVLIPQLEDEEEHKEPKRLPRFFEHVRQIYLFARPQGRAILYNSMMQGGVLNRESVYTIENSDVSSFYTQIDYGIGIQYNRVTLAFYQSIRTKEFKFAAESHRWGGVNIIINY